jgi:hypothetical protein
VKTIVIMLVLLVLVAGGMYLWFNRAAAIDRGLLVSHGFTEPADDKSEIHIEFTEDMVRSDPPRGWPDEAVDWKAWTKAHFELRDSSDQPVDLGHVVSSPVAMDHRGSPAVGFATGGVTVGASYTAVYIPNASQATRYSLKFTVPATEMYAKQVYFVPPNAG